MNPSRFLRLLLAISLSALLVLSAAMIAAGNSHDPDKREDAGPGSSPQNQPGQSQSNESRDNRSSEEQRGPPDDSPGADGQDRRPVDPVAIRDNATGFRTEAPAGSKRPEFTMDAGRGVASLHRSGMESMDVQLDTLVEYVDENDNGAYDLGERVVQRYALREASYELVSDDANESRDIVYDLGGNRNLTLRFHFGSDHGPDVAAKFDVIIEDYPFQQDDSQLAIGMHVKSAAGLQAGDVADDAALSGTRGDEVPYLSWERQVIVDGEAHNVGSSVHLSSAGEGEESQNAIVYWSYPQGASIVHDPILGVTDAIDDMIGDLVPFLIGTAAAIGLMGAGYMTRRRTRL